jgi:hypothetical protein
MVRVQAPALSLEASGSLAGALVFAKWKGRPYVRSLVKPANPRSGGQVGMRAMLKFLSQDWTNLSAANQATWEDRADQQVISEFNAYVGYNQFRWRDFLAPTQHDPEDTADTPSVAGTLAAAAGVRSITVTQPITTANDGWAIALFRGLTTGFDSAFDNLIQVRPIDGTNDVVFVDSPLDPDQYFYVARTITADGQLSAEGNEANATVT